MAWVRTLLLPLTAVCLWSSCLSSLCLPLPWGAGSGECLPLRGVAVLSGFNALSVLPGRPLALRRADLGWVPGSERPSNTQTLWLWKVGAPWLRRHHQRAETQAISRGAVIPAPNVSATALPPGSHAHGALSSRHLRHVQEAPGPDHTRGSWRAPETSPQRFGDLPLLFPPGAREAQQPKLGATMTVVETG